MPARLGTCSLGKAGPRRSRKSGAATRHSPACSWGDCKHWFQPAPRSQSLACISGLRRDELHRLKTCFSSAVDCSPPLHPCGCRHQTKPSIPKPWERQKKHLPCWLPSAYLSWLPGTAQHRASWILSIVFHRDCPPQPRSLHIFSKLPEVPSSPFPGCFCSHFY